MTTRATEGPPQVWICDECGASSEDEHAPCECDVDDLGRSEVLAELARLRRVERYCLDLRRRVTEFVDAIKAGLEVKVGSCCWCGEHWPNPKDLETIRALATAHDTGCPKNPLRLELEGLRTAIGRRQP